VHRLLTAEDQQLAEQAGRPFTCGGDLIQGFEGLGRGILGGLALATVEPDDPSLADALLVCATEVTTVDEIEVFASALRDEIERGRQLGLPGIAEASR